MRDAINADVGQLILRLAVGVIFLSHGIPKLLGGVGGTGEFFAQLGIPLAGLMAWVVTLLEVGGGALLIAGALVVPVAALLVVHMFMGIVLVHLSNGWFVVGPGQDGAEFNVLLIAGLLSLILTGKGAPALGPSGAAETHAGSEVEHTGAGPA